MKTDYFVWTNRVIYLFFLKCEEKEFIEAYMNYFETRDITKLCSAACLEQDKNKLFEKSRWHHVKDEHDLKAQCKRMKSDDKYIALSKAEIEQGID